MSVKEDILVDIPDEDLPKLAKMYEKHTDWAPHAYSAIITAIEWRRKGGSRYMSIMSPNNCWKEDGTFFMLVKCHSFDIFIFTLENSSKNVYEAIVNTKRLDTNIDDRKPLLFCIHSNVYSTVMEAIKVKGTKILIEIPCHMYCSPREESIMLEYKCPSDVYIKELDTTHASIVNEEYPHKYDNSEKFISLLIAMNGGYGVFLKSNDELVSWCLFSMMGQLSQLQTKSDHMRKGYASLITKYASKKLAEKGHNAFATVLVQNSAALQMFQKIGFKDLGIAMYTIFDYDRQT